MNKMKPVSQDIVVIRLPPRRPCDISRKSGNMALNRCCIDEEMANESSGVFDTKNCADVWDTKDSGKGFHCNGKIIFNQNCLNTSL